MAKQSSLALQIGDKVRLTGKFLKSTGQHAGGEGRKTWIVVGFWVGDSSMVLVNEPISMPELYADLPIEERPVWRTIAAANLCKVGELTVRNCP